MTRSASEASAGTGHDLVVSVDDLTDGECRAVAGGDVLVARVGDEVVAYRNRCLHKDTPLDGGYVRDGVLTCPLHFWRYRLADGGLIGSPAALERVPLETRDGEVLVTAPCAPHQSMRDLLLQHAHTWQRQG